MNDLHVARSIVALICPADGVYGSAEDRETARGAIAAMSPLRAAWVAALMQNRRWFSDEQVGEVRDALRAWADAEPTHDWTVPPGWLLRLPDEDV